MLRFDAKKSLLHLAKLAIILLVVVLLYREFRHIDMKVLIGLLVGISEWERFLLVLMGLGAFLLITLYDFTMIRCLEIDLSPKTVLKIGWISAAFNNLVGLGGISGGTVRAKMYQDAGVSKEKSLDISVSIWAATTLGLAFLMLVFAPVLMSFRYFGLTAVVGLYVPFFMFGQKVKVFYKVPLLRNIFSVKSFKDRLILLVVSSIEWLGASLFFGYLLRLYNPSISYGVAICTYIVAMIIAMASFLPGGFGSFELMCVLILRHFGHDTTGLAASILIYRMLYYIVPWVLGMLGILWTMLKPKLKKEQTAALSQEFMVKVLFYLCLLVGGYFLLSAIEPEYGTRFPKANELFYSEIDFWTRSLHFFVGVFMLAFSRGIHHRLKSAWWAILVLFCVGAFVLLPNHFSLKSTLIYFAFVALIYFSRDYFDRDSIPYESKNFFIWCGLLLAVPIGVAMISFVLHNGIYEGYYFLHEIGHFMMEHRHLVIVYIVFALVTSYVIGWFISRRICPEAMTEEERAHFFELVSLYGGTEFTHLAHLKDKRVFFNEKKTVAFLYRPYKSHILVLGDPIGKREDFEDAIDEFEHYVTEYNMVLSFYEVSGKNLELYATEGYSFMKIGEEAFMDLEAFTLVGKKFAYFRNIYNRMNAGMYEFKLAFPEHSKALLEEVKALSDLWLGSKKEKKFSVGYFDEVYLNESTLALVYVDGVLEGFANLRPFYDEKTLSIDLMRIRPNGANAVMDAVFLGVILWAKENGYKRFSLGMAPFANVGLKKYSKRKEKLLRYAFEFGNQIYGFKGLRRYKEKYRPDWENRYLIFRGESRLPLVLLALAKTINTPE